jgi:hypothetical protein
MQTNLTQQHNVGKLDCPVWTPLLLAIKLKWDDGALVLIERTHVDLELPFSALLLACVSYWLQKKNKEVS